MKKKILLYLQVLLSMKKTLFFITISVLFWTTSIIYSIYLGDGLRFPDEKVYFTNYGNNIAIENFFSLDGIDPTAFHPPLYPLLLGLLIKAGFGVIGIRLLNYAALYLSMLFIFRLLVKQSYTFSPSISIFLILGYPVLFYTAGTLYPQTIGALFLILALFFYWGSSHSGKATLLSGFFLGLSILTIPTFLFVLPFFILFSFWKKKASISKVLLLTAITFLTILPWTIRNYLVFDRFVLVSSNFGTNFLIGNSAATTPNNGPSAWVGMNEYIEEANKQQLDEFDRNTYYTQSAINLIKNDPVHYGILYLQKVVNFFNFHNDLATKSESSISRDILMLISYGFLLIVVLLRLSFIKKWHLSDFELLLYMLYLCSAFVSAIVFTRIRYRLPFDFFLIMLASIAIDRFLHKIFENKVD